MSGIACLHRVLGPGAATAASSRTPLVVFAHAAGFCKEVWQPVFRALDHELKHSTHLPAAVRVVAFDFQSHGDSAAAAEPSKWPAWAAADVLAAISAAQEQAGAPASGVVGVGHSMGGAAILLTELYHPGTFQAIEVVEPIIAPEDLAKATPSSNQLSESARRRRNVWPTAAAAAEYFRTRPMFQRWDPAVLDSFLAGALTTTDASTGACVLKCNPDAEAQLYQAVAHEPWGRLGELAPPVHVVNGEAGFPFVLAAAPHLQRRLRHGTIRTVAGGSHFWPMEQPARLALDIAGLLGQQAKL